LKSARIRGISVEGDKRKVCTKRDTWKRKIRANKGKNSHFQFGYQQNWAFISESFVRSAKPKTLKLSELENGEIKFLNKNKAIPIRSEKSNT